MNTKVEALEGNQVKVVVTVDAKEIDARIKKTYKDFAHKYNFPGFRKGKAPRPIIDNALGADAVRATVTDDVINETYPLVIDAENLYLVGKPEFGETDLIEAGKPYEFAFTVAVAPQLELSSYEPVDIKMPADGASDAEIEEQIDALREHYYSYVDAPANTKVKAGSHVDLAMKAADESGDDIAGLSAESRIHEIGSGLFPEAFDEKLMGLKKGQDVSFELDVPADEASALMAAYAGKKVAFDVTVTVVKKKAVPELTDEWVKDTLGFENVDELREQVKESIVEQKSSVLPRIKENACLAALIERLEGDVPAGMAEDAETGLLQDFFSQLQSRGMTFDAYLAQQGITNDQFKEDIKMQALDMAKQDLALDAWARHEGMVATDEEVIAEFEKSGTPDPKALYEEWRSRGQLVMVRQGILRTKAALDIMEKAQVTEVDFAAEAAEEEPKKKAAKKSPKKADAAKEEAEKADAE